MLTLYPCINDFIKNHCNVKANEVKIGNEFFQALDEVWKQTYEKKYKEEHFQREYKKFQHTLNDWKNEYDKVFKHLIHRAFNKPEKITFRGRQYSYEPSWEKIALEHFLMYLVKNQIAYFIELDEWLDENQDYWKWKIRLLNTL